VQKFMRDQPTELAWILAGSEAGVEPQHLPIGSRRRDGITNAKLGKQCQRTKKRMIAANTQKRTLEAFFNLLGHGSQLREDEITHGASKVLEFRVGRDQFCQSTELALFAHYSEQIGGKELHPLGTRSLNQPA
jgi:hypothetical protein